MAKTEFAFNFKKAGESVRVRYISQDYKDKRFLRLYSDEGKLEIVNILNNVNEKFESAVVEYCESSIHAMKFVNRFLPISIAGVGFYYGVNISPVEPKVTIYIFS